MRHLIEDYIILNERILEWEVEEEEAKHPAIFEPPNWNAAAPTSVL